MIAPGLKVVSGFMRAGEELSGQLDCMIVLGQGQKINYLDKYVYPARQVLAVIEIKKTIYARQFEDAYGQLADVSRSIWLLCVSPLGITGLRRSQVLERP